MIAFIMCLSAFDVLVLLLVLYMSRQNKGIHAKRKSAITLTIILTVLVIIADALASLFDSLPASYAIPNTIVNVIGFTVTPFIPLVLAHVISPRVRRKMDIAWSIPALLNALLVLLSPSFGFIFTVSASNVYARGSFYLVYIVSYVVGILRYFFSTVSFQATTYIKAPTLFFLFGLVIIGTTVQLIDPAIHLSWTCVSFAIVICYSFICEYNTQLDSLTALFNRRVYDQTLESLGHASGIVIFFDIDRFKQVNDNDGHAYGDYCLNEIGQALRTTFTGLGLGYRIGGDEFCIICTNAMEEDTGSAITSFDDALARLRKEDPHFPTVSYGSALFNKSTVPLENALILADQAMYAMKQEKRKRPSA